jgi:hypothetical protein
MNSAAVFAKAHTPVLLHALAPEQAIVEQSEIRPSFGRDNQRQRPADHLGCGIANDIFGAAVPREQISFAVIRDDGVFRTFNNRGKETGQLTGGKAR